MQSRNSNDDSINAEQDAREQEEHELQKAIKASLALQKGRFREGEDQDEEHVQGYQHQPRHQRAQ